MTRLIIPALVAFLVSGTTWAGEWVITGDAKKVSVGCSASFVTDDGISGSLGGLRRNISFGMSVKNAGSYLPDKYEVNFRKSGWEAKGVYSVKTPKGTLVAYGDSNYGSINLPLESNGNSLNFFKNTGYFKLSPADFLVLDKLKMGALVIELPASKKAAKEWQTCTKKLKEAGAAIRRNVWDKKNENNPFVHGKQ